MLTFEKGVPRPPKPRVRPGTYAEAFSSMAIGDSVLVDMTGKAEGFARRLALRMAGRLRMQFQTRRLEDGNVRIWRTK